MKFLMKKAIANTLFYTGITAGARKFFPIKDITILMYHKVDPTQFEKQIAHIKKYYNPISEKELYDYYYNNKKLPQNSVLLTFDDGYLNNYLYAYPILKKYDFPATIFLVTSLIGKKEMAWFDKIDYILENTSEKEIMFEGKKYSLNKKGKKELLNKYYYYAITMSDEEKNKIVEDLITQSKIKMPKIVPEQYAFMNWTQVKEMMPLISFGAHTHNHPILPNLSAERKKEELEKSRKEIKKNVGDYPLSICYPNGDYDEETMKIAKNLGYKIGYSSNFGRNTTKINKFALQRIGANINDSAKILFIKLTKLSSIFQRAKTKSHFKVIMITNYYYPQTGGITTVVDKISSNLRKNGINTQILAYPPQFRKIEKMFSNSKIIHRLLVTFFILYSSTYILINKIFNEKLIIHSHSANFCAIIGVIGKYFGCETIHTFHTHLDMDGRIGETSPKPYLDKIDQLTAVSDFLGKSYSEAYHLKTKIRTIYNGAPEIKKKIKRKYDGTIRILFVGHLFDIKDPILFVKTIEYLSKTKKVEARMIGDGNLFEEITEYLQKNNINNIQLMGSVNKQAVESSHKWADVLVMTSKGEGLGVVLLEAMSSGLPVISTVAGGTPEIIENKKDGILVKERTPQAIANAILFALKNSQTLTNNAQKKIENKFDWKKISHDYINMYKQLTQEKTYRSSEENAT